MPHICSRCGAAVEDSSPFCPACDAPQIQFVPREATGEPARLPAGATPVPRIVVAGASAVSVYSRAVPSRGNFLRTALHAGVIGGLLSLIPFAFAIALPVAGLLAVRLLARRDPNVEIGLKTGFSLGALTGLVGFGVLIALQAALLTASKGWGVLKQEMVNRMHQFQAANPDPQAQQVVQFFMTQQGMAFLVLASLVFVCVVFIVLAGLGGLFSASVSGRRPSP